jgi:hypothetical protein
VLRVIRRHRSHHASHHGWDRCPRISGTRHVAPSALSLPCGKVRTCSVPVCVLPCVAAQATTVIATTTLRGLADTFLPTAPHVEFLRAAIRQLGCPKSYDVGENVHCVSCPLQMGGGYHPPSKQVRMICAPVAMPSRVLPLSSVYARPRVDTAVPKSNR